MDLKSAPRLSVQLCVTPLFPLSGEEQRRTVTSPGAEREWRSGQTGEPELLGCKGCWNQLHCLLVSQKRKPKSKDNKELARAHSSRSDLLAPLRPCEPTGLGAAVLAFLAFSLPLHSSKHISDDLWWMVLTRPLPGGFGVEDGERVVAVKGGLQECHWYGGCQWGQAFSKGRTLPGNKEVHLEVVPPPCWPHALVDQASFPGCLGPLPHRWLHWTSWALSSAGLHVPPLLHFFWILTNGLQWSHSLLPSS